MNTKMMLPIELTKILYQNWEGQISVSSEDSEIYGRCLNGQGRVTFKNGNKYQGEFYNGLLHGKGKFIWFNGIEYQGEFTDNRITGHGIYKWPDTSVYEGEVKDGLRNGFGKYIIDEATYEGEWVEGKKQGKGKIIFKSGSIFQGSFKNDTKEGYGKMYYYPSGNYFEGQWSKDKKQGRGTMNWTDIREKYIGEWKNNHQEGWGMHIWLESKGQGKYIRNRYEGEWVNGVREGYGVFYYANGSRYEGYWKDNMKEGYSFYTNQNGRTQLILFKKDRMIRGNHPITVEESGKKAVSKKQVQPNFYSLCLDISFFYYPSIPNLELLFNYLLRNNTSLKSGYKGISQFYDQQSEFSFCLNLEGAWKLIRSLKILGNFSLATLDRGLIQTNPKVRELLGMIQKVSQAQVDYENIYYKHQANNYQKIHYQNPQITQIKNIDLPFEAYNVHDREKDILFREFIHLLVWIGFNMDPSIDKPHKSVEKIVTKINPFLESIAKMPKTGMNVNDNMSDNKSSVSKAEKNIAPFYKNLNSQLFTIIQGGVRKQTFIRKIEGTVRVKQLLSFGKISGVLGENDLAILQKIIEKFIDNEVLNQERKSNWENSTVSSRILNIMDYQLIQYQFNEIMYILLVKKIGSQKQNDENKRKYKEFIDQIASAKVVIEKGQNKQIKYKNERRVIVSKKNEQKLNLIKRRQQMQISKQILEQKQKQRQRELYEIELMMRQDIDVKNDQFEQQEIEFQI